MHPAHSSSTTSHDTDAPLARIDAQEIQLILPLRGYLETNGCTVLVNPTTDKDSMYHFIVGSKDFVKEIFSSYTNTASRRVGIVVGSEGDDAKKMSSDVCRIIAVDEMLFSINDIEDIVSFFFSENQSYVDKRRSRHEPVSTPPVKEIIHEVSRTEDAQRIQSLISEMFTSEKKPKNYRRVYKKFFARFFVAILFFLLPFVWYVLSSMATGISFGLAANALRTGHVARAQRYDRFGNYWKHQGQVIFSLIRPVFTVTRFHSTIRNQERLLSFYSDLSHMYNDAFDVITQGADVASLFLPNQKRDTDSPASRIEQLRLSLKEVETSSALAQAQLTQLLEERAFPFAFPFIYRPGREALAALTNARKNLTTMDEFFVLYPRMAGFNKPTKYLVLLQNSNELRPTGGFIGSIALVTFDAGVMTDYHIQDVYEVDGQLKGHVDPPLPIRDLLGQEHWYLRDSNWDPDFAVSGAKAAWFYQKETGETVDGVIALSVPLVVNLLKVTGAISLSDYNDRISAENFFGKSLYYTQQGFFPGSTQKSDFLGSLSRALVQSLTTDGVAHPMDLFRAVSDGLDARDILFYFSEPQLQQLVTQYQWAGNRFAVARCHTKTGEGCIKDPLSIVDANLSVSKVNFFVKKTHVREIAIDERGNIIETITVNIENTSPDTTPGVSGPYTSYLRLYLPTDAEIGAVSLDSVQVPEKAQVGASRLPHLDRWTEANGIKGVGVAMSILPKSVGALRITYTRPRVVDVSKKTAVLQISEDKQAGVSDTSETMKIQFPSSWSASLTPSQKSMVHDPILASSGKLEYNTTIERDISIFVTFIL